MDKGEIIQGGTLVEQHIMYKSVEDGAKFQLANEGFR